MHAAGRDEQPTRQGAKRPPPIGYWLNQGKTNGLVVQQNGSCGFLVNGKAKWSGTCR